MNNSDMPVNPIYNSEGMPSFVEGEKWIENSAIGLTKREHLAAMAMQGILANPQIMECDADNSEWAAKYSVRQADALLAALQPQGG